MSIPPGPPPMVAAVYWGPPGGGAFCEITAWGRSHFLRPTPGLSYPNPSPAVAAASSSTPIVCMELLQLPRPKTVGPRPGHPTRRPGENACHPDFHCDRLGHGRVEALDSWNHVAGRLDRSSNQIESTRPEPDHGLDVRPIRHAWLLPASSGVGRPAGDRLPDLRLLTPSVYDRAFFP